MNGWSRKLHAVEDETEFTPWAELGWSAYNGMSPEVEVCTFASLLVRLMKPAVVVETGVGQGYMTRAIAAQLREGQMLFAFESDDEWREMIAAQPFWSESVVATLRSSATPNDQVLHWADLCFFDSDFPFRIPEITLWHECAKPGALALIHDTGEHHSEDTLHSALKDQIVSLGMHGVFLHNPRGCFLAFKL